METYYPSRTLPKTFQLPLHVTSVITLIPIIIRNTAVLNLEIICTYVVNLYTYISNKTFNSLNLYTKCTYYLFTLLLHETINFVIKTDLIIS